LKKTLNNREQLENGTSLLTVLCVTHDSQKLNPQANNYRVNNDSYPNIVKPRIIIYTFHRKSLK